MAQFFRYMLSKVWNQDTGMESDAFTEEKIDKLTLVQASGLCEELQIDSSQCTTLAEVRSLLKEELIRKGRFQQAANERKETAEIRSDIRQMSMTTSPQSNSDTWSDEFFEPLVHGFEDQMKRDLMEIYDKTNSLFDSKTVLEGLKEITTGSNVSCLDRFRMNHEKLMSEDCPIVITGETSAGKSTLINLLIGEELLPHSVLQKTRVICCLHYSAYKRIVYHRSERITEQRMDQNFFAEDLSQEIDKMMEDTSIKLIEIYWPIRLLENQVNITLVDTPGLGDNEDLVQILLDYLPKAVGFIYVLNSANAGGIEKNKILRLLKEQINLEREGENVFDVSSTIFVCNKWDQVTAKEDKIVIDYIQNKLEECMALANKTMDSKRQILRFSASEALEKMRGTRAFTKDFAVLLETIKDLVSGSLERKYIQLYRWLRHLLLEKMYETANAHLRYNWTPFTERRILQTGVEQRLKNLQKKCREVLDRMKKEGSDFCERMASNILTYLRSQEVSTRLCTWTDSQLQSLAKTNLEEEMEKAFIERIKCEIVYRGLFETDFHTDLEKLKNFCSEMFQSLDNEIKEVRSKIEGAGHINDLPVKNYKVKSGEFDRLFEEFSAGIRILLNSFAPVALLRFLLHGSGAFIKIFYKVKKEKVSNYTLVSLFEKHKRAFVEKKMKSFLTEQLSVSFVEKLISELYYEEYISVIDGWCNFYIPQQIAANQRFLDNIIHEEDFPNLVQTKYQHSRLLLRALLSPLILFRFRFLEKPFINEADIKLKGAISSGSIKHVKLVEYHEGQSRKTLAMKAASSEVGLRLHEIESLMTLKHPNIVRGHGVMLDRGTEIQNGDFNIHVLMELCDETAENMFFGGCGPSCSTINDLKSDEGKDALRFFMDVGRGTCGALKYMHENGVLHGNLKLSKILISNRQAKLTGMGSIQYELAVSQPSMTGLSHFAPELLIGKPYYISSDVYSLGIALWEMWFGRRAFSETELQIYKPAQFANRLFIEHRPDTKAETTPSDKLWKDMQSCLAFDYDKRPKIEQMLNTLSASSLLTSW